jgi:membrane protease YdiL (CAAX protease family)
MLVFPVLQAQWMWPHAVRAISSGIPGARMRVYYGIVSSEWLFTICVLGSWFLHGRSWSGLMLAPGINWGIVAGLAFALIVSSVLWFRNRAIISQPEKIEKVRQRLTFAEPLLPHTAEEHNFFTIISLTAGFCEEVLVRGFLLWYFAVWTGLPLAAILSSLVFGFGHIYLGWRHMMRTGLLGLVFVAIVLATQSLWPTIIIHAAIDFTSGDLAFHVLNAPSPGTSDSTASVSA